MSNKKRTILLVSIILGAIALSFLINLCISLVQGSSYPIEYSEQVEKYASEYNVPEYIIYAVIATDSEFEIGTQYEDGSQGLMHIPPQILKKLSSQEHLDENVTQSDLSSPEISIRYGTYYLRYLFDRYKSWDTAIIAYNAGENTVSEWLRSGKYSTDGINLKEIPLDSAEDYFEDVSDAIEYYKNEYYRNGVSVK